MPTSWGYARTSTNSQVAGLADQIAKLKAAGCSDQSIYSEQVSSMKMEDRAEFAKVLKCLKPGDELVFTSLSRAARSMIHMMEIEAMVSKAGATIRILDLTNCDTRTVNGRFIFNLFASVAVFERDQMLDRQAVGIAAAKAAGKYKGRTPTARAQSARVIELASKKLTKKEISAACGISIASVYKILAQAA